MNKKRILAIATALVMTVSTAAMMMPSQANAMITKQIGVILPKDSFTDGGPSEFAEFFKQKCVRTCGFRRG